jgi:hypothetical protein
MMRASLFVIAAFALAAAGCKSAGTAADAVKSAGEAVAEGASDVAGAGVSLVKVNLSNVLNDLALDLNIDKANIPINAQIPITIAANVCGVSINILSVSTGGSPTCTAVTTSPELSQTVQQQLAAGGSVGGGGQTSTTPTTDTTGTTGTTTDTTSNQQQEDPPQ